MTTSTSTTIGGGGIIVKVRTQLLALSLYLSQARLHRHNLGVCCSPAGRLTTANGDGSLICDGTPHNVLMGERASESNKLGRTGAGSVTYRYL